MGAKSSMNIHVCGLDYSDAENYNMQIEIVEQIFPKKDIENSNQYYDIRKSENPK